MRLVRTLSPALLLFVVSHALAQTPVLPVPDAAKRTVAAITAADVLARIAFLASDELKGRDTPSPGLERAATYIADEFKSFGLQPAGDSGTFIQRWDFERKQLKPENVKARLSSGDWNRPLSFGTDFFVIPGERDSIAGAIFFAGNATLQPSPLPAAARGQIVAYYVAGTEVAGDWLNAVRAILPVAFQAEPQAVVLLLDPGFSAESIAQLASQGGGEVLPAPLIGVRHDAAKEWVQQAGADLDAWRASGQPQAAPTSNAQISAVARVEITTIRPPNVVAILPGSDPVLKDSYIVFSAHMDHVGVGAPDASGDSIYNGADDDASGTSTIIEVAQAMAALPQRPRRSIIFLTVSGEEKGLLGSAYFVEHSPVPPLQIVANINIDMVGRNHPDTVVAIGQEYTTLGPLVQQVATSNPDLKLKVAPDLWPQEQLFFRSDHFNFARKNIPAIFFTTGLHDDYHQPSDEVQTIDTDKVARIARLVLQLGQAIAASAEAPKWTEQGIAAMKAIGSQ